MNQSTSPLKVTAAGFALLALLTAMTLSALLLWMGGDRHTASAEESAPRYYAYPGFLPMVAYVPTPVPTPVPTVPPVPTETPVPPEPVLFLGEVNKWSGKGYLYLDEYSEVGHFLDAEMDAITAPDVVRGSYHDWYDPNPHGFPEEEWYNFYAMSTGHFLSTSFPSDSAWKFGYPLYMPSDVELVSGQTLRIDGKRFSVVGPYGGVTAFGVPVNYWLLENIETILYYDDGGPITQSVRPGNLELHYAADISGVLLFSSILRDVYYFGSSTGYDVKYVTKLTASNALGRSLAATQLYPARPAESLVAESRLAPEVDSAIAELVARTIPADSLQLLPPVDP